MQRLLQMSRFFETEAAFAVFLGVPVNTLHAWKTGRRKPSAAVVRLLDVLERLEMDGADVHTALVGRAHEAARVPSMTERLYRFLRHDNLNHTELARLFRVSSAKVGMWVNGKSRPRGADLARLIELEQIKQNAPWLWSGLVAQCRSDWRAQGKNYWC